MSTILVVDDEYVICDILGFALEDAGYQVEKASGGKKALEVLQKTRVELLITDYMMPEMDGKQLATELRERPGMMALPIILMSGAQAGIGRENPELFNEVLQKPFEPEEMIRLVNKLVGPPGE